MKKAEKKLKKKEKKQKEKKEKEKKHHKPKVTHKWALCETMTGVGTRRF